jgi:DNA primase catalytic subunit
VHCWVCDPEARNMNNDMRTSVAQYINIPGLGNEKLEKLNLSYPLHPRFKRAYDLLAPNFEDLIIN